MLPEIGSKGQARLASSSVSVVGAGGLGSAALPYLAGAGVGRLGVIDPDRVSESNLHRQTLYREVDVGCFKARVAADVVASLNRDCRISPFPDRLDPENLEALVGGADVVLDCADSFAVTYMLSDFCRSTGQPLVSASALGFSGYVGGFCGGGPSVRAVFPELPSRAGTCASGGIVGPVVGTLGALQAQMALALLLELEPSPLGRMVTFDGRSFDFRRFCFSEADEPPGPILGFIGRSALRSDDFVVDLRDRSEAPEPVTPSARRLGVETFGPGGVVPLEGQRAVLCCRTGLRAWRAARRLREGWRGEISLLALGDVVAESQEDSSASP